MARLQKVLTGVNICLISIIPDDTSGSIGVKRKKLSLLTSSWKTFWSCLKTSIPPNPPPKISCQIVLDTGIPHTSVYRKVKWLLDEKLLIVDKIEVTDDGKKSSLFRTVLKSFNVKYEYNNVVIEAEQNFDTVKKITETFFSLDRWT